MPTLSDLWNIVRLEYRFLSYLYRCSVHFKSKFVMLVFFFFRYFENLWHELGETEMRLLNFETRNIGVILSNQFIFQCPKCQAFAIAFTRPFVDLRKFCQNHQQGNCPNKQGSVFFIL